MSYTTWGWNKNIASTIWGADWDYCSTADYVIITLDPSSSHCIQEVLIVTIPSFQHSCPHKLDQYFQLSNNMCSHYFLVRTDDDLSSIINGNKVWFVGWSSLIHSYWVIISWSFYIMFLFYECHYYFFL